MSVLIKGMMMPTSCYNCWALDDYGDYPRCRITEEQRGYNFQIRQKRMDNCPLVEIPPHGRLIDADVFKKENIYYYGRDFIGAKDETCLCELIEAAPTIIKAEEEEMNKTINNNQQESVCYKACLGTKCIPCKPTFPECKFCEYAYETDDKK